MKTTISIDINTIEETEQFLQNHIKETPTSHLNQYYEKHTSKLDDDIMQSQYDLFAKEDW